MDIRVAPAGAAGQGVSSTLSHTRRRRGSRERERRPSIQHQLFGDDAPDHVDLLATGFESRPDDAADGPPPDPMGDVAERDDGFGWMRDSSDGVGLFRVHPFDMSAYIRNYLIHFFDPFSMVVLWLTRGFGEKEPIHGRRFGDPKDVVSYLQAFFALTYWCPVVLTLIWWAETDVVRTEVFVITGLMIVRVNAIAQKYARRDGWRARRFAAGTLSKHAMDTEQLILGWYFMPFWLTHYNVRQECHLSGVDPATPLVFSGTTMEQMSRIMKPVLDELEGQGLQDRSMPTAEKHKVHEVTETSPLVTLCQAQDFWKAYSNTASQSGTAGANPPGGATGAAKEHSFSALDAPGSKSLPPGLSGRETAHRPLAPLNPGYEHGGGAAMLTGAAADAAARELAGAAHAEPADGNAESGRSGNAARLQKAVGRMKAFGIVHQGSVRVRGAPANRHKEHSGGQHVVVPLYLYLLRLMMPHSRAQQARYPSNERHWLYSAKTQTITAIVFGLGQGLIPIVVRWYTQGPATAFGGDAVTATIVCCAALHSGLVGFGFVAPFCLSCLCDYYRRAEWLRVVGTLMAPFDMSPDLDFVPMFHRLRLHRTMLVNYVNWSRLRRIVLAIGGVYSARIQIFFFVFMLMLMGLTGYLAVPSALGFEQDNPVTLAVATFNSALVIVLLYAMALFGSAANGMASSHVLFLRLAKERTMHSHALIDSREAYRSLLPHAKEYHKDSVPGAQFVHHRDSLAWQPEVDRVLSAMAKGTGAGAGAGTDAGRGGGGEPGGGSDDATAAGEGVAPALEESGLDVHLIVDAKLSTAITDAVEMIKSWDERSPVSFMGVRADRRMVTTFFAFAGAIVSLVWRRLLELWPPLEA